MIAPQNKKEDLIFSLVMTIGMAFIMSSYSMYLALGRLGSLPLEQWLLGFARAWVIAFCVERLLGHPLAMWVVKQSKVREKAPQNIGKVIGLTKLLFMTTTMSCIGMYLAGRSITLSTYPLAWLTAIVASAPSSILIVSPLARKVLKFYRDK